MLKLIEIIKELRNMGYDVSARKRTDGGYIITEINGEKYTGAHGNTRARTIVGASISEAKAAQLSFNVEKYIKGQKKVKDTLDDEMIKELRKTQRAWNKARKQSGVDFGRVTKRKLRYKVKTEGRSGALVYLQRMRRHAEGIAYPENVMHLLSRMKRARIRIHQGNISDWEDLITKIESIAENFLEKWIAPIYEIIYDIENQDEGQQKTSIEQIHMIIGA